MNERAKLLHNMSTPPRSVVKYSGLSGVPANAGRGEANAHGESFTQNGTSGAFVAFRLPKDICRLRPKTILKRLGFDPGNAPEKTLVCLIEQRAKELALPDACVVVPTNQCHPSPGPDILAALAIITKSSGSVWLRGKTPRLSVIKTRSIVSLLVPPPWAAKILELSR